MPGPGAPGPVLRQQSPARHGATRVPSAAYSGQAQSFRGHHSFASPAPASPRLIAAPGQAVSRGSFQGAPLVAKGSSGQDPTPDRRSAEEQDRNAKERGHDDAPEPREDTRRTPGLCPNFVDFFNDNVNMMVMAATITSFANGLAGKALGPSSGPIMLGQASMVLCVLMVSILRMIGLSLYRKEGEDSIMRLVYGTMLTGLPWFLRVPTVVLIPSYLQAIYNYCHWDPAAANKGEATSAFFASFVVFVIVFSMLLYLGRVVRSLNDAADPDASWATFFLQCLYLAAMSGAGKAMYYTIRIVLFTMAGPVNTADPIPAWPEMLALFVGIVVMTTAAWCSLTSTLPNQMDNPSLLEPFQHVHLQCQQYVVVYTWAFATVDFGWTVVYSYVGGVLASSYYIGMALFLCWLAVALGAACLLAATTPDNSFYDMGKGNAEKATACLMNYWLVDFITWWFQAQVVTSLDTDVADPGGLGRKGTPISSSWPVIATNFVVLLLALFVVGGVHACNHEVLAVAASKRKLGIHQLRQKSLGWLPNVDGDDADEDGSGQSDGSD